MAVAILLSGVVGVADKANAGFLATTTAISASPSPSTTGGTVTFTVTVTCSDGISCSGLPGGGFQSPGGTVTLQDSGATLGSITLTSKNGSFQTTGSFQTSALAAGSHTITAAYGGDVNFNASTGTTTQQVNAATNTTPATSTTNLDSQNLTKTQMQGSMTAAPQSGSTTAGAVSNAVGTQLGGGQQQQPTPPPPQPLTKSQFISLMVGIMINADQGSGLQGLPSRPGYIMGSLSIKTDYTGDNKAYDKFWFSSQDGVANYVSSLGIDPTKPWTQLSTAQQSTVQKVLGDFYSSFTSGANVVFVPSTNSWLGFTFQNASPSSSGRQSNYADEQPSAVTRRANEAFAQLGDGVLVTKAPGKQYLSGLWSVWADISGAGFNQSAGGGLNGNQINATAGIGYKLRSNVVVGLFGGYENFNYDFAALEGRLKGNGGTLGTYAGWAITPMLRWDAMLGWTGLSYDDTASTASGSFTGSRWLFSTTLSGSYRVRQFVLEPSASVFALNEHQSAYTDSLGTAHDAISFSSGRASLGGRVLLLTQVQSFPITPYVGFYGDRYFASDSAALAGAPSAGFGDSWSARAAAGVSMPLLKAGTLSLGGDYGGIGANYKVWTGTARANVPF